MLFAHAVGRKSNNANVREEKSGLYKSQGRGSSIHDPRNKAFLQCWMNQHNYITFLEFS